MRNFRPHFIHKWIPIFALILGTTVLVPKFRGQNIGSVTRVRTIPDGLTFFVDGQVYTHSMSAIWPAGSIHTLFILDTTQIASPPITEYVSGGNWTPVCINPSACPAAPGNPAMITADPNVTEYNVNFDIRYQFSMGVANCSSAPCANPPGTVTGCLGTTPATVTGFVAPHSACTVTATPNPGWALAGWQTTLGGPAVFADSFTVTADSPGKGVWALFAVARPVTLTTNPAGLQVLADRTIVTTPITLGWALGTTHSIGPVSPQRDLSGKLWTFESWSDGGAPTHAIPLDQSVSSLAFTATYAPAASVSLLTSPPGLTLSVDGSSNWPVYNFIWGVGEMHQISAPSQQTDANGQSWVFSNWSNGGAQSQSFTVPAGADVTGVRLTAVYGPQAHLTVNSSLAGLSVMVDGSACATPCDIFRPVGTKVHVSAPVSVPAGTGSRNDFLGWSDGSVGDWVASLGPTAVSITASYHLMNQLSATTNPPNGANWRMQPASPDGYYDSHASVNISLTALPGFKFVNWSGDLSGSYPAGMVSMNAPRNVVGVMHPVPYVSPAGVGNAAGLTPVAAVAPGSIISVFGVNLATGPATSNRSLLSQTLGGLTVNIGDRLMPLMYASQTQVNLQLPADTPEGAQTLTVNSASGQPVQVNFTVQRDAPGVFQQVVNGQPFAIVFHEDGTLVTTDSPAQRGELLTLYGTGFGPTNPARPEGLAIPTSPSFQLVDGATVQVGDANIQVEKAYALPGAVGVDAVQFRLGDSAPSSTNAPLTVSIGSQVSNSGLLPVQ